MKQANQNRGFSMVELIVVTGILLVMTVVAVPSIMHSMKNYQLSEASRELGALMQRARFEAIRLDRSSTPLVVRTATSGNRTLFYIDLDNNGAPGPLEPQTILPTQIQIVPPSASGVPSATSMGFTSTSVPTNGIAFDARGGLNFGGGVPTVYAVYLGYSGQPSEGFRAVTVTPVGRTQVWKAGYGSTWYKQ